MTPRGLAASYLELLGDLRGQAARAVALGTLAGLLEGVAVTALIPLLGLGQTNEYRVVFGLSGRGLALASVAAFVVIGAAASLSRALSQRGILRVRTEVDRRMRIESLQAVMAVDWSTFHKLGEAEVAESVLAEGDRTADGLQSGMQAVAGLGAVVALSAFAVFVAPRLSLVALIVGSAGVAAYRRLSRRGQGERQKIRREAKESFRQAVELVAAAKYLRSTGQAADTTYRARDAFASLARTTYLVEGRVAVDRMVIEAGAAVFLGALLLASALTGAITPETLVFFALFYRVVPRVLAVQEGVAQARLAVSWYESWRSRIETLRLDRVELPQGRSPRFEQAIEFDGLTFTHRGTDRPVLRDLSVRIVDEGEFVALVGSSGSGKTTVLDLLTGLLTPTAGAVLIDGVSLQDIDVTEWQRRIGLVLQDTPLQQDTVLANIIGRLPPDIERARRYAEIAEIDTFVSSLPLGYETLVGERGGRLSGGERQRIALARALYREPLLLLLDEPTSALDPVAEASIMRSLVRVKGRCTIVLVAHRLSTVRHADRILFLQEGTIFQTGTWAELESDREGPFAEMLREQEDPGRRRSQPDSITIDAP